MYSDFYWSGNSYREIVELGRSSKKKKYRERENGGFFTKKGGNAAPFLAPPAGLEPATL
ncbi:MAG: hypothetical protein Q8S18_11275 [Bacteroidales bacterium]|nr:hypothetical protein [Bacteroidales bacterium]